MLAACLESIARQGCAAVFVADNDPVAQEASAVVDRMSANYPLPLACRVVSEPGISAARNAILDAARGYDFLAMLDDDETAALDWLSLLLKTQRETNADAVGGPVRHILPPETSPAIRDSVAFRTDARKTGPTSYLWATGNLLVSCRALERLNWPRFDPSFGLSGGEDAEWLRRLAGCHFAWCAEAVVSETVPEDRATPEWVKARAYRIGNSDMRIKLKHDGAIAALLSALKSLPALAAAPILPSARWTAARGMGKIAALLRRNVMEYSR
jgi:succinoglycan biosynthesis protein ExoM